MPDPPIKPPNKRVNELTTQLTGEINKKYSDESIKSIRDTKMIDYTIKELAYFKALCEEYEKIIDENKV